MIKGRFTSEEYITSTAMKWNCYAIYVVHTVRTWSFEESLQAQLSWNSINFDGIEGFDSLTPTFSIFHLFLNILTTIKNSSSLPANFMIQTYSVSNLGALYVYTFWAWSNNVNTGKGHGR